MVDITCGVSLQKAARMIAITDMVYCFIIVIIRTAYYIFGGLYLLSIQAESTNTPNQPDIFPKANESMLAVQHLTEHLKASNITQPHYIVLAPGDKEDLEINPTSVFEFIIGTMLCMMIYIILELYLCRLLIGATKNLDKEVLKKWWWYRLALTLVIFFISVVFSIVLHKGWFGWILELVIFYRVYELVVINKFKTEIAATNSRVPIRNSTP